MEITEKKFNEFISDMRFIYREYVLNENEDKLSTGAKILKHNAIKLIRNPGDFLAKGTRKI
ncbi:MAG: hypothetical protein PHX21_13045 [bacterium]|nr:hypothetical protein [bacterium]